MPVEPETQNNEDADHTKYDTYEHAKLPRGSLGAHCRRQSPFAQKIPDTDTEVKRRRKHTDQEKRQIQRIRHVVRDRHIGRLTVCQPALGVKVPGDINESDQAGVTLEREKPVFHPGISRHVRLPLQPYIDAVSGVVQKRKKNEAPFGNQSKRNRLKSLRRFVVLLRAHQSGAVRPKMLGEESSNRNNASQRMEFAEEITWIWPGCRSGHALSAASLP